jgi:hypothetical protein
MPFGDKPGKGDHVANGSTDFQGVYCHHGEGASGCGLLLSSAKGILHGSLQLSAGDNGSCTAQSKDTLVRTLPTSTQVG